MNDDSFSNSQPDFSGELGFYSASELEKLNRNKSRQKELSFYSPSAGLN